MKKRILIACMSIAAVFALAACGSSANTSGEDGQATDEASTEAATAEPVSAPAVDQRTVYVTPEWVKSVVDGNQAGYEDYVIAEVTYSPDDKGVYFTDGHLPGAIQVFDTDVEDAEGTVDAPYNLLPAEQVEEFLLSHGITKDTKVILYGADPSGVGRVAYGYLWAGVEDVKILNGGMDAWTAAGYELETDVNESTPATDFGVAVPAHPEYWVSMDDAKDRVANDDNFKLVSIRGENEWLGETSGYTYIDRAGEPEGAVWGKGCDTPYDVAGFTNDDGTIMDVEGAKELWADCDFTLDNDLAFYCGTGWRATVPFLICYQAGYDNVAVYDGGWYEWQLHDDNPVQVGDPASDDCQHVTVADLPTDRAAKE